MRKIFYIMGLGLWLSIVLSCSKDGLFLKDPNNMPEADFWKTEKDALYGLAGVFDAYQNNALMGKRYREFDHITDNAIKGNATGGWNNIDANSHSSTDGNVSDFWKNFYNVNARANEVIAKTAQLPASVISDESRKRIMAEAAFLRAYVYHDLTAIWINVPIYLEPIKAFDKPKAASTRAEVITYFTNELETEIIPNLPLTLTGTEKGRIKRGTAQALLGKFYLLAKNYQKAADAFKTIIDSHQYALYPDYAKLFTPAGEFSSESLFEINFIGSGLDVGESFSYQIDTTLALAQPLGHWAPIKNLVDSYLCTDGRPIANKQPYGNRSPLYVAANPYSNRDPRLRATIYTKVDTFANGGYIWKVNVNNPNNSFAVKKYTWLSNQVYENGKPQNYYVIRYAEVLLGYAEAKNEELGTPDQSVRDAINAVRQRVGMPNVPTTLTKEQMRQFIRDEKRWEFALEHQRFFDLKRWEDANGDPLSLTLPPAANNNKKASKPRVYAWPYPQVEMDRNPALKAQGQNAGY